MAQTLWQKTKGHGECLSNMQDTVVCSVVKLCLGAQPPWAPYEREEGVICVHWILRHSPVHSVSHEAIPFSRLFGKDLNCTLAFPHTPENNTSLLCVFTLLFFLSFFFCVIFILYIMASGAHNSAWGWALPICPLMSLLRGCQGASHGGMQEEFAEQANLWIFVTCVLFYCVWLIFPGHFTV